MSQALPFDMVIVGATGDLAGRKLLPSLYTLHGHDALPTPSRIFGVARQDMSRTAFVKSVKASLNKYLSKLDAAKWKTFSSRLDYLGMSATEPEAYASLKTSLDEHPERVRVFYLATAPRLYGPISQALAEAGLLTKHTRIVLEKPIGTDLDSAREINNQVGQHFTEDQIYRIDHYLGKETVQNLMALRFSNALFEPLWRREHIDHVQITVAETLGVEGRGGYYDRAGALRDMVQNHLLQLLCLTAMEPPASLDQDAIREEKIKVLQSLRPMTVDDVRHKTVRAQYRSGVVQGKEVPGYLDEEGIEDTTRTETFVALKAEIDNWRWAGVPFYLRTGKRMGHRVSEIIVQFKKVPHLLFEGQESSVQDNRLVIRLQPDESIKLGLMMKSPGAGMELRRKHLNLDLSDAFDGGRPPLAYERLLLDVIRGNATLFMHRREVEEAWRWAETVLDSWEARNDRPRIYAAGTWGPPESIALLVRDHDDRAWYEHVVEVERSRGRKNGDPAGALKS